MQSVDHQVLSKELIRLFDPRFLIRVLFHYACMPCLVVKHLESDPVWLRCTHQKLSSVCLADSVGVRLGVRPSLDPQVDCTTVLVRCSCSSICRSTCADSSECACPEVSVVLARNQIAWPGQDFTLAIRRLGHVVMATQGQARILAACRQRQTAA